MPEVTAFFVSKLEGGLLSLEVSNDGVMSVASSVLILLVDSFMRPNTVARALVLALPALMIRLGVMMALNISRVYQGLQDAAMAGVVMALSWNESWLVHRKMFVLRVVHFAQRTVLRDVVHFLLILVRSEMGGQMKDLVMI